MANIKILISENLIELYKKMTDLRAAKFLMDSAIKGVDITTLEKDFACYIKISREDKTQISYNTISEVAKKLEIDVDKLISGEVAIPTDESFYTPIRRTKIRPGRIFTKIFKADYLSTQITNSDVEAFGNRYTAELNNQLTFEIVKGEEIRKSYHKPNYTQRFTSGTLHQSCMNGDRQQEFLDIYTQNENVSLLVAYDVDNKVAGRAIVWLNVAMKDRTGSGTWVEGNTFMDRIYFTAEWMQDKFKDYARKNGWFHRKKQAFDEELNIINSQNVQREVYMKVAIENLQHRFFPYMDTFFVPSFGQKYLSNNRGFCEYDHEAILLRQTSGLMNKMYNFIESKYEDRGRCVWMKNKKTYYPQDGSVFSSKSDDYYLKTECFFSKLDNEHVTPDEEVDTCVVTTIKYKKVRMVQSDYHGGLIHKKEAVDAKDKGTLHKSAAVFSKTFKCWLSQKGALKVEAIDDFIPMDVVSKVPEQQFIDFLKLMNDYLPKEDTKKEAIDVEQYVFEF